MRVRGGRPRAASVRGVLVGASPLAWPTMGRRPLPGRARARPRTPPPPHPGCASPSFFRTLMGAVTLTRVPASTPSFISLPGPNARTARVDARPRAAGAGARVAADVRRVQVCMVACACVRVCAKLNVCGSTRRRGRIESWRPKKKRRSGRWAPLVASLVSPNLSPFPSPSPHARNATAAGGKLSWRPATRRDKSINKNKRHKFIFSF